MATVGAMSGPLAPIITVRLYEEDLEDLQMEGQNVSDYARISVHSRARPLHGKHWAEGAGEEFCERTHQSPFYRPMAKPHQGAAGP